MSDVSIVLGVLLSLITLFFTFYKWWISREDKRHQAHEDKFAEHFDIFSRHEQRIEGNEQEIRQTRDELHRDYVRGDQLDRAMSKMDSQFEALHRRMTGISRELSETVGTMKATADSEMQTLVREIKEALKSDH